MLRQIIERSIDDYCASVFRISFSVHVPLISFYSHQQVLNHRCGMTDCQTIACVNAGHLLFIYTYVRRYYIVYIQRGPHSSFAAHTIELFRLIWKKPTIIITPTTLNNSYTASVTNNLRQKMENHVLSSQSYGNCAIDRLLAVVIEFSVHHTSKVIKISLDLPSQQLKSD